MIDRKLANRLDGLEQERFRLVRRAAGYRLQAINAVKDLAPQAARVDLVISVLRYAREHWALTATLLAVAGLGLRKQIGVLGLAQTALRLGSYVLSR